MALATPFSVFAQPTTGFNQTAAGPFDYNDAANWVDGTINGAWDSALTITAAQTVTFASDTTLETGLNIGYTGNFDLTFRSDGGTPRTLTLEGDVVINPTSNRTITFGSATANDALNIDLGGDRVFTIGTNKALNIFNTVSGGDFTVTGTISSAVGGTFRLSRANANAATSNITVANNATLQIDNSTNGNLGTTRAASVTLVSGGKLSVRGNNNTNTEETITGALTVDGGGARLKSSSNSYHNVTVDAGSAHTLLTIGSLERVNKGTLLVRGDNLGVNAISAAAAGSSNIQITGTAPTLVGGGGAAGSTTISIVPWLVGGTTVSDSGTTFVTYTESNGLRPLDYSEFASGFGGSATDNVRITATTDTAIVGDATVNSLILAGQGGSVSGEGTLTVTSGAILMTRTTGASSNLNVNINFGTAEGIIGYARGDVINGAISGSGGLTLHGNRNDEVMQFLNGNSTYTGDTAILANAQVITGFLPHGDRTGDVYVYGNLQLHTGGYNGTINGLFGNGTVAYGNSSASSISIGDNDATSTFTGTISGNNNLAVSKIGAGTLTLVGAHTWGRSTSILGGTLEVTQLANGGVASGIGSGSSTASNLVINGGTLKYTGDATSTDRLFQVGQTTNGGTATIDASGTGAVNFTNTGSLTYGTVGTTGSAQTRTLILTGTNTDSNTLSAIIGNNGNATNGNSAVSVVKDGTGTWVLAGANTYTGTTTINAGTLALGASERIANSSNLILAGGTFDTRGFSETLGTLTVTGNAIIDLGDGASSLVFDASNAVSWADSVSLSFVNYTDGLDSIRFGFDANGLSESQLLKITINGFAASINDAGFLAIASNIPEPSAFAALAGLGALGAAALRRRRRSDA